MSAPGRVPGVARRLACAVYDLLVAVAVLVVATFPFVLAFDN